MSDLPWNQLIVEDIYGILGIIVVALWLIKIIINIVDVFAFPRHRI